MGGGLLRLRARDTHYEINRLLVLVVVFPSVMCTSPNDSTPTPSVTIPATVADSSSTLSSGSPNTATSSLAVAPADRRVRGSFAVFVDSNLDRCADVALLPPVGIEIKPADAEKIVKGLVQTQGHEQETTRLPGSCQEAFKDRPELASCANSLDLAELARKRSDGTSANVGNCDPAKEKGCKSDLHSPKAFILELVERYYSFERAFGSDCDCG